MTQFQVGDIVRLKNYQTHQRVTHIAPGAQTISTKYLNTEHRYYDRSAGHFEHVKPKQSVKKAPEPMTKIFETKTDPKRYGSFLANDSQGKFVLEMKGNPPTVEAFAEIDIKEVIPYTVEINGAHFIAAEGQFKQGDVIVVGTDFRVVGKIDTGAHSAKKLPANVRRVMMEPVT